MASKTLLKGEAKTLQIVNPREKLLGMPEIYQQDPTIKYLHKKGARGANNFEMMMNLHLCDIRKRISILRRKLLEYKTPYVIASVWMESDNEWKVPYKQYYLMKEPIHEAKCPAKSGKERAAARRGKGRIS